MTRCFIAVLLFTVLIGCDASQHEFVTPTPELAEQEPQSLSTDETANGPLPAIVKLLPGEWGTSHSDEGFFESWENQGDTLLKGIGYQIDNKAVTFEETLMMKLENGHLAYIAMVADQNGSKAISFPLIEASDNHFQFYNPDHDYPQQITYDFVTDSLLIITISGLIDSIWDNQNISLMRQH